MSNEVNYEAKTVKNINPQELEERYPSCAEVLNLTERMVIDASDRISKLDEEISGLEAVLRDKRATLALVEALREDLQQRHNTTMAGLKETM